MNELLFSDVTPSGIVTSFTMFSDNVFLFDTNNWRDKLFNMTFLLKQFVPIDVTLGGMLIDDMDVFKNAFSPILSSVDGNWTLVNDEH